ncbi:hypothetical protein TNCV_2755791 [Trichonephila clavipes]|nr:hypothetical protein TNCV_2755791 [Trichonephila clavipes]
MRLPRIAKADLMEQRVYTFIIPDDLYSYRIKLTHNIGFLILMSHWLLVPPIEFHWSEEISPGISSVYPEFHSDKENIHIRR